MKFYIDTEFSENRGSLKLISIGIACENGKNFYAENSDFDSEDANEWVKENVLPKLVFAGKGAPTGHINAHPSGAVEMFAPLDTIRDVLQSWIQANLEIVSTEEVKESPEFWGYFADYDWVLFCWIFGAMIELPKGYPMYCLDLKQEMINSNLDKEWKKRNCPDPEDEHNALADAIWNKDLHRAIDLARTQARTVIIMKHKSFIEILDEYGASTRCGDWQGWVMECRQYPERVMEKWHELRQQFDRDNEQQISNSMSALLKIVGDHRCAPQYKKLIDQFLFP